MSDYEAEALLSDDEYSDMLDRGQQITALQDARGFQLWVDRANRDRFSRQIKLISGGCKSYDEYVADVAWLQGVAFALEGVPKFVNAEIMEYKAKLDEQRDDQ